MIDHLSHMTPPNALSRRHYHAVKSRVWVALAFEQLDVASLEIVTDPDNLAPRGVALRNGFVAAGSRGARDVFRRVERR